MNRLINKASIKFSLFAFAFINCSYSIAQITATQVGMYDFAVMQSLTISEMNGTTDVTAKLQDAVNTSRDLKQSLFIPSGTYLISDQIRCVMTSDSINYSSIFGYRPNLPVNIIGSAVNSPTFLLSDNIPVFNQGYPLALFHYQCDTNLVAPTQNGKYNSSWLMDGGLRGFNLDLGTGNLNAVGIYWASAQHTYVDDITIYANDAFAGLTSMGGRNSSVANVTVIGGKHGVFQVQTGLSGAAEMEGGLQTTMTGCSFVNQSDVPISVYSWGGATIVGTTIITDNPIAIELKGNNSVYRFPFSIIDSKIEFTNTLTNNIVFSNPNQVTVSLRGVYAYSASLICDNNGDEDLSAVGSPTEWSKIKRYNYVAKTAKATGSGNPIYFGTHYNALTGTQHNTQIANIEAVDSPPVGLVSQHIWSSTPSFEDADAVLVLPGQDIQAAIDTNQKVCLAKGEYVLSQPLILKSNTILVGCPGFGETGSILEYGWVPTQQTWLIETENDAAATTYLLDITTDPGNADYLGSLHWQAGRNSIIRNAWFDIGWDTFEKDMIRLYFSGNGGGRVFNYQDEKRAWLANLSNNSTSHRKVKIMGTSQQLTFYGLNLEQVNKQYVQSTFPLLEIDNSSKIRIFGAKTETYQPYALINNSSDIFMTNIIDLAISDTLVDRNYIQITGSSDNIEVANSMFLKPANAANLIVADPWNTNEVPRTMTLGCYHYNWSSISEETSSIDTIAACNSYTWIDGNVYNNSNNTAVHLLTNSAGFDSIVTLNLTITTIDATTTTSNQTITSNQTGATYQWIDCATGTPLTGETGMIYTAITNGDYSVLVSQNGCSETSACVTISTVNINENSFGAEIILFPNPTTDLITLELGELMNAQITITDLSGKVIYTYKQVTNPTLNISMKDFANVTYLLEVLEGSNRRIFNVIKQ